MNLVSGHFNEKIKLSPLNYDKRVTGQFNLPARLTLCDATIREGSQGSIIGFTFEDQLEILKSSVDAGVKLLQIGVLLSDRSNLKELKTFVGELKSINPALESELLLRSTPLRKDQWQRQLDLALETGVTYLDLLAIFTPHSAFLYGDNPFERVIEDMGEQVAYYVSQGGRLSFDPMDGPRTDYELLIKAYRTAIEAGAERIRLLDTVGTCGTAAWRYLITNIRNEFKDIRIGVHCHNDFGQAMANVFTSIECGVDIIDVCINGLGERAGNPALAEVAAAAELLYGFDTGIQLDKMCELSIRVGDIARQTVPKNKPITGDWVFAHAEEDHYVLNAIAPWLFDGIKAEVYGNKPKILLGLKSGVAASKAKLLELGYNAVNDELAKSVIEAVKAESKIRRVVLSDEDIRRIADKVYAKNGIERQEK